MSTVIVVGGINLDCMAFLPYFPLEGSNLRARDLRYCLGGRGANQAVALTNLKTTSILLGKVGDDFAGDYILNELKKYKVNTEYVVKSSSNKTGSCSILVSPNGENTIIGYPAVNRMIGPEFLIRFEYLFEFSQWLTVSLEYPLDTVLFALKMARKSGMKTVLDPSPLIDLPNQDLWPLVDYVLPNLKELKRLTGEKEILAGALALKEWGVKEVIVKHGATGSSYLSKGEMLNMTAFPVKSVVDTTGAGDLFNAAFIYGLIQTGSIETAVQIANLVASYAVQKRGTCESFPMRRDIDWSLLQKKKDEQLF